MPWLGNTVLFSAKVAGMAEWMAATMEKGMLSAPGAVESEVPRRAATTCSGVTFVNCSAMSTVGLGMMEGGIWGVVLSAGKRTALKQAYFPGSWSCLQYFEFPGSLLRFSPPLAFSGCFLCPRIGGSSPNLPTLRCRPLFFRWRTFLSPAGLLLGRRSTFSLFSWLSSPLASVLRARGSSICSGYDLAYTIVRR